MTDSPLKAETMADTVTFEYFGRTWSVPSKQRMSHLETFDRCRRLMTNIDLALANTYLSAEEYAALRDIDPTAEELDEFGTALAKAMGFGDSGNS